MRVLHLLVSGKIGGIERLCLDISKYSKQTNYFYFVWEGGEMADLIACNTNNIYVSCFKHKDFILEYRKLRDYCKTNLIEAVVVQHTTYILWLYGFLLQKDIDCKLFIYAHSNAEYFLHLNEYIRGIVFQNVFKLIYRKCDKIVAISYSVKKSIRAIVGNDDKVEICYNGIDINRFQLEEKQENMDTIVYVGRLIQQKGVDILLEAITIMDKPVKTIIVGDGPEMQKLKKMCKDKKITDRVKFVGKQVRIAEWYKKATVFVHPSICEEGFGITLVEAMASGVPCVAFHKGAIPEIITDGRDGFLVSEVDAKSLASKLEKVFTMVEKEEWNRVRINARRKAESFSIEKMINKQEKIWAD